jgi:sugar/nucleoside kinase (ribokinase family)
LCVGQFSSFRERQLSMTKIGIFAGLSTIDIIHNVTDFPTRNSKVTAQSQEIIVGGPATNAAVTFAFLGGSAKLITAVGRHAMAYPIKDECRRFGIEVFDLTPDSDAPPPISSVWVNRHGERSVVSVNTTRMSIPSIDVDPALVNAAEVLMVDGHAMQASQAWAQAAKSAGVRVVFDGGSWKPGTDELLKSVDIAICSADFRPPGCASDEDVIAFLRTSGVADIAITHGADPVRFASARSAGTIEVPRVEAVDTMGAGDIFHGAFCFYSAQGREFEDALREAAKMASDSCRYSGTRKWMDRAKAAAFGSRPQIKN